MSRFEAIVYEVKAKEEESKARASLIVDHRATKRFETRAHIIGVYRKQPSRQKKGHQTQRRAFESFSGREQRGGPGRLVLRGRAGRVSIFMIRKN